MSRANYSGESGSLSAGGVDYKVTKWSGKLGKDKLDITATSSGGWKETFPGGLKQLTGDFEAVYDSGLTTASSSLPTPFTGTQVAFVLTLGSSGHTLSFTGEVDDVTFENDSAKTVMIKGGFSSSGAVTFA